MDILAVLAEPKAGFAELPGKVFFFQRERGSRAASYFQINAIFPHRVFTLRDLRVFHKRAGNEKGIGDDFIRLPADDGLAVTERYVVDFIAVFAMAVFRDGTFKAFQDNVGNMEIKSTQREM